MHGQTATASRNYYEEDDENENEEEPGFDNYDPDGEWRSKGGWSNYHSCTLSSTKWGHAGVLVGTEHAPFDPSTLFSKALEADPLPVDLEQWEKLAFGLYLTGHDSAGEHRIRFHNRQRRSA